MLIQMSVADGKLQSLYFHLTQRHLHKEQGLAASVPKEFLMS